MRCPFSMVRLTAVVSRITERKNPKASYFECIRDERFIGNPSDCESKMATRIGS